MSSETQSLPNPGGPPKRHLRNYLLQPRFQLKYTGMVVACHRSSIASVLGYFAYDYSRGQTESLYHHDEIRARSRSRRCATTSVRWARDEDQ